MMIEKNYKTDKFFVSVSLEEANEELTQDDVSLYINFFGRGNVSNIITSENGSNFLRNLAEAPNYYRLTVDDLLELAVIYAENFNKVETELFYDGEPCPYTTKKDYGIIVVLTPENGDNFIMERRSF